MTDASSTQEPPRDWRDTVFLPKTDFPMKAGLAAKEPAILDRWARIGVYDRKTVSRQSFGVSGASVICLAVLS